MVQILNPHRSLVSDDNFGLFEAMSAIEVMDPKMDAGMLCNKELCKVRNMRLGNFSKWNQE